MGNHVAGQAIGQAAELAIATRKSGETALGILDRICKKYRGSDAEFEAEDPEAPGNVHPDYGDYRDPHPQCALGRLMVEAFAPAGLEDLSRYAPMLDADDPLEEAAYDAWAAEVEAPFSKRYGFC
mgnify:FL=1